jgi:flagellar protein FliT
MTMTTSNASLPYYELIGRLSRQMLMAARLHDWTTFLAAEQSCAMLIARLQDCSGPGHELDADGRRRKSHILRGILADDAQIRDLTQPWLAVVDRHLGKSRPADSHATPSC